MLLQSKQRQRFHMYIFLCSPPEVRGRSMEQISSHRPQKEPTFCWNLDLRLLASTMGRQYISAVLATQQVMIPCYHSPSKVIQVPVPNLL